MTFPSLVAVLQTVVAAEAAHQQDSPQQGTTTAERFVTKAAALLKDGHTPDSVAAAIITGNREMLRPARSNIERLLRFRNRQELRAGFTLFARAYQGDSFVKRVSHAYRSERIDFRNGTSILFHAGSGCLWPLACNYPAPCPGCEPRPETLTPHALHQAAETSVIRPGDTLLVRLRSDAPVIQQRTAADRLRDRLPDTDVLVITAEDVDIHQPNPAGKQEPRP
jgi:hypothetical protein